MESALLRQVRVIRHNDPETAEPSVSKNPEQPCRSEKNFVRGNFETKCIGDASNHIETDANVYGVQKCANADSSLARGVKIFRTYLRRA
jgi:hypothetical protein